MNAIRHKTLADRGVVVSDSSGNQAVRVYLAYLRDLPDRSLDARRQELRERFQRIADKSSDTGLELDPQTLSVSGQVIQGVLPIEHFDQAKHELEGDDVRFGLVEYFDATL